MINRRLTPILVGGFSFLLLLLQSAPSVWAQEPEINKLGLNQPVLVIVTKYAETEDPRFDAQFYADAFNATITPFYAQATRNQSTFQFQAYDDVIEFPYTYESTAPLSGSYSLDDDPEVIDREVRDAIGMVFSNDPEIFDTIGRVYVIVNRPKRARARRPFDFLYTNPFRNRITVSSALQNDPYALFRANSPFTLTITETDTDGDGIDDTDELNGPDGIAQGLPGDTGDATDPSNWDTDGDLVPDGEELNVRGSSPLLVNTDGDAFSDWEEIVLDSDPADPAVTPALPTNFISTVTHELGHHLELPDLYRLDIGGEAVEGFPETYENWGLMALHRNQNFSAFSRLDAGWDSPDQFFFPLEIPEEGLEPRSFVLSPPGTAAEGGIEILSIKRPAFSEVLIEARDFVGLDVSGDDSGLPATYVPGALLSITDPRYNSRGGWLRANGIPFTRVELHTEGGDGYDIAEEITSRLIANVSGPGVLSYRCLVQGPESSCDVLLDGALVVVHQSPDPNDFELQEFENAITLDSGEHTITWTHRRPANSTQASVAWLDDVVFDGPPIFTSQPENLAAFAGDPGQLSGFLAQNDLDALTFQWFKEQGGTWFALAGATERILDFTSLSLTDAGRYRLQATNASGSINSREAMITVTDPVEQVFARIFNLPDVTFTNVTDEFPWEVIPAQSQIRTPSGLPQNIDSSLRMTLQGPGEFCFAALIDEATLQFSIDGVLQDTITAPSSFNCYDLSSGFHTLQWTAQVDHDDASDDPAWVILNSLSVQRPPTNISGPNSRTAVTGMPATLPTVVSHTLEPADVSFQWYHNNLPLPGANAEDLTLAAPAIADSGEYYLEVTSRFGTLYSEIAVLTVYDTAANPVGALLSSPEVVVSEADDSRWTEVSGFARSHFPKPTEIATLESGDAYQDAEGLLVEVNTPDDPAAHPPGSIQVTVSAPAPPKASDVWVVKTWLDNAKDNRFGEYGYGVDANGVPFLLGDRVYTEAALNGESVFPPIFGDEIVTFEHKVEFLVENQGEGDAQNIRGTVFILPFSLWMDVDIENRVELSELALAVEDFEIDRINAGESVVHSINYSPDGKFRSVVLLDRVENEFVTFNNTQISTFHQTSTSFGSPYKTIEVALPIQNNGKLVRYAEPVLRGLPDGWTGQVTDKTFEARKGGIFVPSGEEEDFYFQLQAPDPQTAKPGTIEEIQMEVWTDSGDAYAPFDTLPLVVHLTSPTELTLVVDAPTNEKVNLAGRLRFSPDSEDATVREPVSDATVILSIAGTDGSRQRIETQTDDDGAFSVALTSLPNFAYAARAEYTGNQQLAPALSEIVSWGRADELAISGIELDRNGLRENAARGTRIGKLSASGGEAPILFSLANVREVPENRAFSIRGEDLFAEAGFDYEQLQSVNAVVVARDAKNRSLTQRVLIEIVNDDLEDTDRDGLNERDETKLGLSDQDPDTDRDGAEDGAEVALGLNPADANETPDYRWELGRPTAFDSLQHFVADPSDRGVYLLGSHERQDGLFFATPESRVELTMEADELSAAAVDSARSVFYVQKGIGPLYRFTARTGRPQEWVTRGLDPRSPVQAIAISPPDFNHPFVPRNRGLLLSEDPRTGQQRLTEFLLDAPEETRSSPIELDTAYSWERLILAQDAVYLEGIEAQKSNRVVGQVDEKGTLNVTVIDPEETVGLGAFVHPSSGELWLPAGEAPLRHWKAINLVTGVLTRPANAPDRKFQAASLFESATRMAFTSAGSAEVQWLAYSPQLPPLRITGIADTRVRAGEILRVQLDHTLNRDIGVQIGGVANRDFRVSASGELQISINEDTPNGELVITTSERHTLNTGRVLQILRSPTELRFSTDRISNNPAPNDLVGLILVPNALSDLPLRFQLADPQVFPDNALFVLEGPQLRLRRDLSREPGDRLSVGVTASDGNTVPLSGTFELEVTGTPAIVRHPQGTTVRSGSRVELSAEFAPTDVVESYSWTLNHRPVAGADSDSLVIQDIIPAFAGEYRLEILTTLGLFVTDPAQVIVDGRTEPGIAVASMPESILSNEVLEVRVEITPVPIALVWTYEERLPDGWSVLASSSAGIWDPLSQSIRWGLFFGAQGESLTYQARPPDGFDGIAGFSGRANFDGTYDSPTQGNRTVTVVRQEEPQVPLEIRIDSIEVSPEAGRVILQIAVNQPTTIQIDKSINLVDWESLRTLAVDAGVLEFQDRLETGLDNAFYRVTAIEAQP